MLKGIDISVWQGTIDWAKVKSQVDFVIIRAGYGKYASQKDARFEEYYAACERHNIPKGVYWFSYAVDYDEAVQEANAFLEVIKGKKFEYPVWFDYEAPAGYDIQKDPTVARNVIDGFTKTVYDAGYYVGLYSYYSLLQNVIPSDVQARFDIWIAHYAEYTPYEGYKMWQYTGSGKIDGVPGEVDMNYSRIENYPEIIRSRSMNGYSCNGKPNKNSIPEKKEELDSYPINSSMTAYNLVHYPYGDKTQISKHFNVNEFACKCGWGAHDTVINSKLVAGLEKLFEVLNCSMIIVNSGYRHPEYDSSMNGFAGKHSIGDAADVVLYDINKQIIPTTKVSCAAQDLPEYFGGIANIDSSYTAIHLDVREGRRWLGNEVVSNNDVTDNFYTYYGLTKEDVYGKVEPEVSWDNITDYHGIVEDDGSCHDPDCHCKCHDKKETDVKEDVVTEPVVEEEGIFAGKVLQLNNTPLYTTAYKSRYVSKQTGTFYVYNDNVVNDRVRITNSPDNVGRTPVGMYVTGWVNVSDV